MSIRTTLGVWAILLLGLCVVYLCQTGRGTVRNFGNDVGRDMHGGDYVVTLYAADGTIIERDTLVSTFIDVSENGSGLRWVEKGRLHMMAGTYTLVQR